MKHRILTNSITVWGQTWSTVLTAKKTIIVIIAVVDCIENRRLDKGIPNETYDSEDVNVEGIEES